MDFFRKAADAVGGLILDSDSESDDERGTTTRRAGSSSNTSSKAKPTTHDDHWTDGDVARAASPDAGPDGSFDDSDDEGDEKLIPDAVWGALAAARGKISEVASTVKRDVASAVEVVKHDLSEFNDRAVDETAAFAGDVAAAEYSTGLGLDDDDTDSDGGAARLDADVVDAFDNAVDALDDVGHKVEEFGVKMLGASKRFFHNLKEELTAEDDGSDGSDRDGDGDGDTRGFTSRVGLGAGARRSPAGVWRRGSRAIEPPNPKTNRQTTAKTKTKPKPKGAGDSPAVAGAARRGDAAGLRDVLRRAGGPRGIRTVDLGVRRRLAHRLRRGRMRARGQRVHGGVAGEDRAAGGDARGVLAEVLLRAAEDQAGVWGGEGGGGQGSRG